MRYLDDIDGYEHMHGRLNYLDCVFQPIVTVYFANNVTDFPPVPKKPVTLLAKYPALRYA